MHSAYKAPKKEVVTDSKLSTKSKIAGRAYWRAWIKGWHSPHFFGEKWKICTLEIERLEPKNVGLEDDYKYVLCF